MGFKVISTIRSRAHRAASCVYRQFRFDKSPRQGLRILMYHAIGTPVEGDVRGLYSMTTPQFVMHMRYLAEHYAGQLVPLDRSAMKGGALRIAERSRGDRKSTRLNSSHGSISYAVFCL